MKSSFITFLLIFFLCAKGEEESRQYEESKDSDNSCYGDVESLSSDSFEQTSDSEGDLSEMFLKGNVYIMYILNLLPRRCVGRLRRRLEN